MNRLAEATSPYLLQHAENPVDWYPWGEEALARAREEDRPILLSIGYAACHWCHVMEHESFEDAETAALMNDAFRQHQGRSRGAPRPRRDLHGRGGRAERPRRLADDGISHAQRARPFYGGTYFPPEPRHGLPSFRQVLESVASAYTERRGDVTRSAGELVEAIGSSGRRRPSSEPLTESLLSEAVRGLRAVFDPVSGGFGRAPKFPPHSVLEFLLRRGELDLVTPTLDGMAAGGMYDLVGGGFHRYAVDNHWLVPHFEKMLYDNALLVPVYLHGWLVTGRRALPRGRGADGRVHAPRPAPSGGRVCLLAGRRHGRRRGADVHVDFRGGACRRSCSSHSSTAASSSAASSTTTCAGSCSRSGSSGRSPGSTTRRSPRGTGSRSQGSRRLRAASIAPAGATRHARSASSSSGRFPPTAASTAAIAPVGPRERAFSTTTRMWRTVSTSYTSRRVSCAGSRSRDAWHCSRSSCSPTRSAAASSSPRPTASSSSCARRTSTTTRSRPGTRCSRTSCFASRASTATTSSNGARSSVLRLVRDLLARAPTGFGWALCALGLHFAAAPGDRHHRLAGRCGRARRARAI